MTGGGGVRRTVVTVPNVISLVRLLLVPLFLWLLLGKDRVMAAGVLLAVIGATDWVDGYLARRLDQTSEIGRILDPVADRLAVAAAVVGGLIAGIVPPWLGWGLIAREALMAVVTGYLALQRRPPLQVRWWGKVATFMLYASIAGLFVAAGAELAFLRTASLLAGGAGLVLYWLTAVQYIGDARSPGRGSRVAPGVAE